MRFTMIFALSCVALVAAAADTIDAKAPIHRATVYQDRARIERRVELDLPTGKTTVDFKALTTLLDPKSLRAAIDSSDAKLLGVSWEKKVTDVIHNAKLSELEKKREALKQQKQELKDKIDIRNRLLLFVENYLQHTSKAISLETTQPADKISPQKWKEAADFLANTRKKNEAELRELDKGVEDIERQLDAVVKNLQKLLKPESRAFITAHVTVEATKACKATITLSYVSSGAGWVPRYDARIDTVAATTQLAYLGEVKQSTGEDWANVELVLSTAKPHISATPKRLKTLWVSAVETGGRRRFAVLGRADAAAPPQPAAEEAEAEPDDAPDEARSEVKDGGHAVTFVIKDPASIPSDGRPYQVTVHEMALKSTLSYETIPKVRPFVYLKASTSNNSSYPLLAGPVSIFRGAGYIGTSKLAFTPTQAPIQLFAGIDESLKVKRELYDDSSKSASLFSDKKRKTIWDIRVKNTKDEAVSIKLRDSVPVSQIEEVEVTILNSTTFGYELDKKTGFITWDLELKPGETRDIRLAYEVSNGLD